MGGAVHHLRQRETHGTVVLGSDDHPQAVRPAALYEGKDSCATAVVVRDLAVGRERRFGLEDPPDAGVDGIRSLAWSPDGRRLAVEFGWEDAGYVAVLDPAAPGDAVDTGHPLGPRAEGVAWSSPAYDARSGRLVVLEAPLTEDLAQEPPAPALVSVDPATGEAERLGVDLPPDVVAVDVDPSGRRMVFLTYGAGGTGSLFRADPGGNVGLADGVAAADW